MAPRRTAAMELGDRDVTLTAPTGGSHGTIIPTTNHLLQDALHMQHILYAMQHPKKQPNRKEMERMVDTIMQLLKHGKSHEVAGLGSVPTPYLSGTGRILSKDERSWREATDEEAAKALVVMLTEEFKAEIDLKLAPYADFVRLLEREKAKTSKSAQPEHKDIVLLQVTEKRTVPADKYENHKGNNLLFHLASQLVTSTSNSPERRVKAALSVLQGLDDADIPVRFVVHTDDDKPTGTTLTLLQAVEFVLTFVFEVWLEKESHILASVSDEPVALPDVTAPVKDPTEYDVLLGRGGLTNAWPGNRRFRDIIALHRPDYIRAIKMDKPAVARKIVKAIRMGKTPGRFLRKGEDGQWYDVGDKAAAEKTSQGLRERSNSEKRQRLELRKALKIRKVDLEEDEDEEDDDTDGAPTPKRTKRTQTAKHVAQTLNYVGASLSVPLSLSMSNVVATPPTKRTQDGKDKNSGELVTEGLPPNAVDPEGNILVTDHDILCGRGGLTNHHKGNKRFRDIVALHRPDYVRAPKIQKPSVARVIVRAIRNGDPPGRFLKKDEKSGKWIDIGDKKAAEKTSQALREKGDGEHDERTESVPEALLPVPSSLLPGTTAHVMGSFLLTSPVAGTSTGNGATTTNSKTKRVESSDAAPVDATEKSMLDESNSHLGIVL